MLYDQQLFKFLRQLILGDGAGFGIVQHRMSTLPIKDGGFGIYTMADTSKYCYLASRAQTQHLQGLILQDLAPLESSQHYQQALQVYTQSCGISLSSFNINDVAPQFMKSLAARYFGVITSELPTRYTLSARESTMWHCSRTTHAMDFLKAMPIHGFNQAVGPRQFRSVLQYRLCIPLFTTDSQCTRCNRDMDIYGDHALHCARLSAPNFVMTW